MKLIELAVRRPIAILSIVLMVLLMGWLALQIIPIQLTPDVRKPLIMIQTSWPGASPAEIEREIVIPQEEKLKGLKVWSGWSREHAADEALSILSSILQPTAIDPFS